MGIEHALLPEQGIVLPGDLVIGADSHTCTYGALGAFSTGVGSTDLAAAMITGELWFRVPESIKLIYRGKLRPWVGGKDLILYTIGQIGVDGVLYMAMELTEQYVKKRAKREYHVYASDVGAHYTDIRELDVPKIEPQVAFPHLPSNTKGIDEVGKVFIDQAVIGSCTNGRLDDLREAARVLKGHKASSNVRLIVIPATPSIYRQAMREGLFDIFLDAGSVISPPTCGPCMGGHMGVLAKGERAIATTNRNFVGRMGSPESEVYLSNPAIAAASAVLGRIGSPEELDHKE
jgi:3-isopropylmalate/(R)-2-methylmalate dehydratase large subunit